MEIKRENSRLESVRKRQFSKWLPTAQSWRGTHRCWRQVRCAHVTAAAPKRQQQARRRVPRRAMPGKEWSAGRSERHRLLLVGHGDHRVNNERGSANDGEVREERAGLDLEVGEEALVVDLRLLHHHGGWLAG
mmetsp:Transcript_13130/g.33528  ORF Transcript_13130/g.33528 Transcript_13130/m.33528 type:complete len:133 (+) Transcript_13130:873-1271(+)